jgi:hypothetical protein
VQTVRLCKPRAAGIELESGQPLSQLNPTLLLPLAHPSFGASIKCN